ncbi:MAG TPA: DUF3014 domain-containing protein [Anaeromyxobacter sp.]
MEEPRTNLRRTGWLAWLIPAVVIAAAGAYGAYRLWFAGGDSSAAGPRVAQAPSPAASPSSPAPADETPVDAAGAKPVLERISANKLFQAWLAEANPIRRIVVILANAAEGTIARKLLGPFAPSSPFSVEQRGDRTVIAAESYSRYDAAADAIDSVDARALASAYRRLHGALEAAFRELGYPSGSLDRLTLRALKRIESAPVVDGDVALSNEGGVWVFADARQERLGDLEKQLLRMGPRNERRLQAKAREIREALQLPAVAAGGR